MRGGMKVYAGTAAAARAYLEADRGRVDDYYLTEGTGLARRFVARDGRVAERAPLTAETYETWVAGRDPDTGDPRGRLRTDERAVRFVEVVVNGPKSWSLAAAVHPDVAAAYDAAQDHAAVEIIGWLAGHATTPLGPRGGQVQVPLEVLEAVTVRHNTSRAGDPHRHLLLQLNARVFAAEQWRGLHPVGVRDFLAAINGIGHAAVACDPRFRTAPGGWPTSTRASPPLSASWPAREHASPDWWPTRRWPASPPTGWPQPTRTGVRGVPPTPTSPALLRRGRPPPAPAFRGRSTSVAVRPSPGVA